MPPRWSRPWNFVIKYAEDASLLPPQNSKTSVELAKILLLKHNQHFYLDVSVSIGDLHQKKFVQFLFRFLPR